MKSKISIFEIRLALSIISGRVTTDSIGHDDLVSLGYDPFTFLGGSGPSNDELKNKAENIIVDAFMNGDIEQE